MKSLRVCAAALLLVSPLVSWSAEEGSFEGQITDDHCGGQHAEGKDAEQCTRACVRNGAKFALWTEGKTYALDRQNDAGRFAGRSVVIKGELNGSEIKVSQIRKK